LRVAVVGTGHVGLVTAGTMAAIGHHVVGVDSDRSKIERLEGGECPFFEPGLHELLFGRQGPGRLEFATGTTAAVDGADVVFICVGTPARATGEANLVAVEQAAREAAAGLSGRAVIVEKSTVPAGTAHRLRQTLARVWRGSIDHLAVASNPEFLREGRAVEDSLFPDRILVGAEEDWAFETMRRLYQPITEAGARLIETDITTAELAKHACNAYLALKISYANALARLCERAGADVEAVADVMGSDARIGRQFLNAGLGYGGYCFPKDIQAFRRLASELGYDFGLLDEVVRINEDAVESVIDKVREALWNLEDKRTALFGLSFKPGTDDVRFSPSLKLAARLIEEGAACTGYDPEAADNAAREVPALEICPTPYEAARGAHCVVISTEWEEFAQLDLAKLQEVMAYPIIADGRNLFDYPAMRAHGFAYYPTGRAPLT
jgi:UDPglucose 6-dehydrogenase